MDEYNSGMDPEVRRYFKKILNSFSFGLLWLLTFATAGIFFKLGFIKDGFAWYNIFFYAVLLLSLVFLVRYFHKTWSK